MNLEQIIEVIDTQIKQFIPASFAPINAFGLTQRYYEDDKFYPGILLKNGEITNPFLQDQYAVSWYHRNETGTYNLDSNQEGDNNDNQIEKNTIDLIIFYNTRKINITGTKLKDVFIDAIPSILSHSVRESLNLSSCDMALVSHELDSNKVFKQECNKDTPDVRIGVEHGLLSIRYEITSSYRRNCVNVCA